MRLPFLTTISNLCCKKTQSIYSSFLKSASSSSFSPEKMGLLSFSSAADTPTNNHRNRRQEKVVVVMGPTGSGKSRLSVELGTRFPSEIINSDKIQVYKGLDITTNKIPVEERLGIPHHLLGDVDSAIHGELTPSQYRSKTTPLISQIIARQKLPLIVGGSNSFIYALLANRFEPDSDVFTGSDSVSSELRYKCCFLWVDVSFPVLDEYLGKRVDDMLDSGMLDELSEFYESEINESEVNTGLRKAIGVPEFERYFRTYKPTRDGSACDESSDPVREAIREEAVKAIKDNTCQLAKSQMEKIQRLRELGWDLQRLDATESFKAVLQGSKGWSDIWERQVVEPSVKIVKRFLEE